MNERTISGIWEAVADVDKRLTALEAAAKILEQAKPESDAEQLRALALKLNRKLTAKEKDQRKSANATYWLKLFAAHALPTAMLQTNTNLEAALLATDAAFELLAELETRLKTPPKAINVREKSQEAE